MDNFKKYEQLISSQSRSTRFSLSTYKHSVALLVVSFAILTHISVAHPLTSGNELINTNPSHLISNLDLAGQTALFNSDIPAYNKPKDNVLYRVQRASNKRSKKKRKQRNKKDRKDRKTSDSKTHTSAVHFHIDTRHHDIKPGVEELKTGERGDIISYWKYSDNGINFQQNFGKLKDDGTFTILQRGLYMVYSQLTYYDRTGRWSHTISVNNKPFIKCMASEWGLETDPDTGLHYNTIHQCYTSAVIYLIKNDKVTVNSMYAERVIHTDPDMTFWGIIKFA